MTLKLLVKQLSLKQINKLLRVFLKEINEQNEPVKTVSEATVDLGHVVEAIKRLKKKAKGFLMKSKAEILEK